MQIIITKNHIFFKSVKLKNENREKNFTKGIVYTYAKASFRPATSLIHLAIGLFAKNPYGEYLKLVLTKGFLGQLRKPQTMVALR